MRKLLMSTALCAVLASCAAGSPALVAADQPPAIEYAALADVPAVKLAGATVLLRTGGGHGSGAYIGDGYIVTAAHVVAGGAAVTVKSDDDKERAARVLWINADFDVALLRIKDEMGISVASLGCREPAVGENVSLAGNPASLEFITTYGRIAGKARKVGGLESVMVVDATVAPGMSGGPVFDADGRVVGLVSALMQLPTAMGGVSYLPVSFIVPGSTVCMLLARVD
ncbi:serine protease [Bosea sp. AS-1]|uniref:S1 family peptidase n=1 Tax=Bosea sp. AS-1 TaxID=2015316 RepID=UPI000B7817A9|nr:serine protease [Bosea sp. AS-1]